MICVSPELGIEHLGHSLDHSCEPCREIQRAGPKRPANPLLRFYGQAHGSVAVVPAKDKRKLRNESRRISRLKARRNREKRALVASLTTQHTENKRDATRS